MSISKMKVAMVNTEKTRGGAARMAALLAQSIVRNCDDIDLAYYHCEDNEIDAPLYGLNRFSLQKINAFLARLGGSTCVYDFGFANDVIRLTSDVEVLHVHNLHGYYLDWVKLLESWSDRSVVWTWHDQWGATGRCGFSIDCEEWKRGCPKCAYLDYYPKAWIDRAAHEFKEKSRIYSKMRNLHVVSPSRWLADIAVERGFSEDKVHVIPNPVAQSSYTKRDKFECRKILELPQDEYIVLFIAADCNDPRKGYDQYIECVRDMPVLPLIVGKEPQEKEPGMVYVGETRDKEQLSIYYSAADVMVFTSKADNYPNTIIECLICGTPVCAYSVGGVKSQVHSDLCKLVNYGDIQSIRQYLDAESKTDGKTIAISAELEGYAKSMWSDDIIAKKYHDLYYGLTND